MKQRLFFILSVLLLFFQTTPSLAAPALNIRKRIVLLETMTVPPVKEQQRWFLWEMEHLGYSAQTTEFTILNAEGSKQKAEQLLRQSIEHDRPDIVVAFATIAAQAAKDILPPDIPLLFSFVADPVSAELVPAIGEVSGTNITGRKYSVGRSIKLETACMLAGQIIQGRPIRFGSVASDYPSALDDLEKLQNAALSSGKAQFIISWYAYQPLPEGIPTMLNEIEQKAKLLAPEIDFWWEPLTPMAELDVYTKTLAQSGKKAVLFGNTVQSVENGALFCMQPDYKAGGKAIAVLADAVLSGQDAGTIPVVETAEFEFAINLTTALKLGIVIPSSLLQLAGKNHIFR